jgi:AcrR family transcriptional regulator
MSGMQRTPRQRLSATERRRLIVDAALGTFAERGYQAASMTEIAAAAGVSASVIYDHFPAKADLQMTLLEEQTDELMTSVGTAIASAPPGDPAARMRVGVDAFFAFVEHHPFAWRMLFRDPPGDPRVAECHRRIQARATAGIADLLKDHIVVDDAVRADEQALEMFAQLLKTAQNGLAIWWYDHRDVPRSEVVDRVIDFCWTGLGRRLAGPGQPPARPPGRRPKPGRGPARPAHPQ